MKLKNPQQQTLEYLENSTRPPLPADGVTNLVKTCHALRKKPIGQFTIEDLRIMIGQEIGLDYLIPVALEKLMENLFAEGHYYEGDLLENVLNVNTTFWDDNKALWQQLNALIKDSREEIIRAKFDTTKFDNCKHAV